MSNRSNLVVYNGRLLSDDTPVDYVLWSRGRDYEILEPDAPDGTKDDVVRGGGSAGGWFLVPRPT